MRKFLFSCTMLAAFGANAAADPFVSGSEPGWGKDMSDKQRRAMGFDDVRAAQKANSSTANKKYAGPVGGVLGYAFNVITIRQGIQGRDDRNGTGSGNSVATRSADGAQRKAPAFSVSQIKSIPFGVYTTLQECDIARAKKIAELDAADLRFPHQQRNAPEYTVHYPDGSSMTEAVFRNEREDVTFCEPGTYSPGSSSDDRIAKQ